jgi:pyrimidine deaminase RibD-like protein
MSHAKNSFLDISIKEKQDLTTSFMGNPGVAAVVVNKDTGVYFLQHIDCDQNW